MKKSKRIVDNPTSAEILKQLDSFERLANLFSALPSSRKLFPRMETIINEFNKIKAQAEMLKLPDQFNERFGELGWVAYESMNSEVIKKAIEIYDLDGSDAAEEFLSSSYDAETLKYGLLRFNGNGHFRKRIRLSELAQEDYLAGRYHACIPLLLSLLDGLVNDVSRHVGFFAENVDLTAWDCIAAHESGLQALTSVLTKGRNKTNEDPISIPYRNGILHGRELAFDNKLVAAKCWAALFAARDWAGAIEEGKKDPKPEEELNLRSLLDQMRAASIERKSLEAWRPRAPSDISHFPFEGHFSDLPGGTPEHAVAAFLDHWRNKRFGPLADTLLYFTDTPKGKKAGIARQDFGKHIPISFKIVSAEDEAPAITNVMVDLYFQDEGIKKTKSVSVRVVYLNSNNDAAIWPSPGGQWKVVQNSFLEILHVNEL